MGLKVNWLFNVTVPVWTNVKKWKHVLPIKMQRVATDDQITTSMNQPDMEQVPGQMDSFAQLSKNMQSLELKQLAISILLAPLKL